ncbi:MAG: hypothetical protein IJF78_12075, partial [Clostridia bacterium]|nr:hypothetical protein [Clostridia bacterium]
MQTRRFQSIIAVMLVLLLTFAPVAYATESGEVPPDESQTESTEPTDDGTITDEESDEVTGEEPGTDGSGDEGDASDTNTPDASDDAGGSDGNTEAGDNTESGDANITDSPDASDNGAYSVAPDTEVKKVITAITDENDDPIKACYELTVTTSDPSEFEVLLWNLIFLTATVDGAEPVKLTLDAWDYELFDLTTPGTYRQTVDIPADGYDFAEGVPRSITLSVTVTEAQQDAESRLITSFEDISHWFAYAVPVDCDWSGVDEYVEYTGWDYYFNDRFHPEKWEQFWPCETETGELLWLNVVWSDLQGDGNRADVYVSRPGVVTVTGTPVLPEGMALAEGVELPTVQYPVSIQDPSNPDLNCWGTFYKSYGFNLPWDLSEELTELADNGE